MQFCDRLDRSQAFFLSSFDFSEVTSKVVAPSCRKHPWAVTTRCLLVLIDVAFAWGGMKGCRVFGCLVVVSALCFASGSQAESQNSSEIGKKIAREALNINRKGRSCVKLSRFLLSHSEAINAGKLEDNYKNLYAKYVEGCTWRAGALVANIQEANVLVARTDKSGDQLRSIMKFNPAAGSSTKPNPKPTPGTTPAPTDPSGTTLPTIF